MFNFFSELTKELTFDNALVDNFNIIILSGKAVYIEGHKGIKNFTCENISLVVKKKLINIFGSELKIRKITNTTLLIEGDIKSVEAL